MATRGRKRKPVLNDDEIRDGDVDVTDDERPSNTIVKLPPPKGLVFTRVNHAEHVALKEAGLLHGWKPFKKNNKALRPLNDDDLTIMGEAITKEPVPGKEDYNVT